MVNAIVSDALGTTRAELTADLDLLIDSPRDRKLVRGLARMAVARCTFEIASAVEPAVLRADVFERSAQARRAGTWQRATVIAAIADEHRIDAAAVDAGLFADLKGTHRVVAIEPMAFEELFARYVLAEKQAVLLRAVQVRVRVVANDPEVYRALFRRLKFRRLLWRMKPYNDGYELTIDGPCSLFSSVARYGLQLALLLPAFAACDRFDLSADIRWGRAGTLLTWEDEGGSRRRGQVAPPALRMPDDVRRLLDDIKTLDTAWCATPSTQIVDLPGVGLCVPDIELQHPEHDTVLVEVMGYWSRAAVWQRVELVASGRAPKMVFCVSERLRVSEEVLADDAPGALLVYKGVIIARRLLTLAERSGSHTIA